MSERDSAREFQDLRRAWRDLPAPSPEQAQPDARTEAAVQWMRGAWDALEPPASVSAVPSELYRRVRPRPVWRRYAPLAAAAALIATLSLLFLFDEQAVHESAGVPQPRLVQIASVTSDRMELRSGPVRLILMTASTDPAGPVRPDESYR